ncbi:hypothetical protein DXG01_016507 [Tephrocybe rancida]|nr:hypothetical protein DXG01_016507 [Tephrocybe rancida]
MAFQDFLSNNGLGSSLRVETQEVFTIISDKHASVPWTLPTAEMFISMKIVMVALISRAPGLVAFNVIGELWVLVTPCLNLIIGQAGICMVQQAVVARDISAEDRRTLILLINSLIGINLLTLIVKQYILCVARKMTGHLRAHFYPLLAAGRYPVNADYNNSMVGQDFPSRFIQTIGIYLTALCTFATLVFIALRFDGLDQWLLLSVLLQFPCSIMKIYRSVGNPQIALSGRITATKRFYSGFNVFTDNEPFLRLCGLHNIVFDPRYLFNLSKDGMKVAAVTAVVTRPLLQSASVAFLDGTLKDVLIDGRNLVSCIPLSNSQAPNQLSRESPLNSAERSAPDDLVELKEGRSPPLESEEFIPVMNFASPLKGWFTPPRHGGMRISYKNVIIKDHSVTPSNGAVGSASFEIQPGKLVLIVGARGSGKTALVEPLIGLSHPTSGEIRIDNEPFASKTIEARRKETTFHTQHHEQTYTLSVLENIMWGYAGIRNRALAEIAGVATGCQNLIAKAGIVELPYSIYQSSGQGHMGTRTSEVMKIARPRLQDKFCVKLTAVEEQRLTAARMLYRLYQGFTRLLVLDEPVHKLTAQEESEVIDRFLAAREGVTTVIVSMRFRKLAHLADTILCMENGRIVQRGTHAELLSNEQGTYAQLYSALGG